LSHNQTVSWDNATRRQVQVALILIFAAALAFRLWGLFNPLLDFHAWRQTLTAMVARNFLRDGMNLFAPRLDDLTPYFEFEFQIFPYLVAILYQAIGVKEWLGRLAAALFAMGTLAYLYALGKKYLDRPAALVAAALFAVLPMAVYYTRAFMPESLLLFFSVMGLHHFGRWLDGEKERGRGWDYALAALGICLAVGVKAPALYLLFPLAFLAWDKLGGRAVRDGRLWIFLFLVLVPPLLWYAYTGAQARAALGGGSFWLQNDKLIGAEYLLRPKFYRLIFLTRLGEKMFAFAAFPLFLAGICLSVRGRREVFLHVWLGAVLLYFFVVAKGNYIHEYYQLPVIPVGCLFAGKAASAAAGRARRRGVRLGRDPLMWAVAALLLFVPVHSVWKVGERLRVDLSVLRVSRRVEAHTAPGDRLLVQDNHHTDLLYYADRKGWYVSHRTKIGEAGLESYRRRGVRYYVNRSALPRLKRWNPALDGYLRKRYRFLEEGRDGIIVDLTRPLGAEASRWNRGAAGRSSETTQVLDPEPGVR